jgi:hypothetical protein
MVWVIFIQTEKATTFFETIKNSVTDVLFIEVDQNVLKKTLLRSYKNTFVHLKFNWIFDNALNKIGY